MPLTMVGRAVISYQAGVVLLKTTQTATVSIVRRNIATGTQAALGSE